MRIAVLGASGLVGSPLTTLLRSQGHEVLALHRSSTTHPVDLTTGVGLEHALAGVDAVVNAANAQRRAEQVLVAGTRRLLEASDAHHVCVSVVGIDTLAPHSRYYRAKLAQEAVVRESGRPYSIIRSTQFHEFLGGFALKLARARIELRSRVLCAPISAAEAAAVIARAATQEPRLGTISISGPETLTLSQLRACRGLPLPLPLGPQLARLLRAGALIDPDAEVRGVLSYTQWLSSLRGRPWRPLPPA